MINYQAYTLENGLRVIHKPSNRNVSYCGFFINAGTRDERADEFGMAHFVEHMLFKGTAKRKSHHIINRMENVGGELNAYTNKEETVIYSAFLEEDLERAMELLTDLTFNSQYPQHELEKEREVIIDEIHSYEDSPSELIFDEFENLVFDSSELGHNILGDEESLATFDSYKVSQFTDRHYIFSNMVFFSVGKTDFKRIQKLSEKYLSHIVSREKTTSRIIPHEVLSKRVTMEKDTSQAHVVIGGQSYNLHNDKRKALLLLNNLLGGPGMNSRLNISLREKKGYVYNVESSITNYTDTGLFAIYFGSDQKNAEKCISLIHRELRKLRDISLTSSQLHAAKKQLIGQIGIASDNQESTAIALGKSYLHYNSFDSLEDIFRQINGVSSSEILEVANEILDERILSTLIFN